MGRSILLFLLLLCLHRVMGQPGELDPLYSNCLDKCEKTGYVGDRFLQHCQYFAEDVSDSPHYMQEPLYLRWKRWNCRNDCSYNCMMKREKEKEELGLPATKYHRRWPFKRISVLQEPVSAALSALNLIMHFNGWLSYFLLLQYKLPLRPDSEKTYYEYTGLWHLYGIFAMNASFWDSIFHIQDFDLIEKLESSAAVASLGCFVILTIIRTFNVRNEASRVMVAAPLLAFITTHILYLNIYELDHGLNLKVCMALNGVHLILWPLWAAVTRHPSRFKDWAVVFGGWLTILMDFFDFAPYKGYIDSHAMQHVIAIPVTYLWWSFISDDATIQTSILIKKGM